MDNSIISKSRVNENGEVFTPENIVKDMLDLVKEESYSITSTFLEPACGNGNFLVEILRRKLKALEHINEHTEYDKNLCLVVSTIYGIDISIDNVSASKSRMLDIIYEEYKNKWGVDISTELNNSIKFILDINIIWGDTLDRKRFISNVQSGSRQARATKRNNNNVSLNDSTEKETLQVAELSLDGDILSWTFFNFENLDIEASETYKRHYLHLAYTEEVDNSDCDYDDLDLDDFL